ncbi:hypothetical protein FIU51_15915, partial [Enterococcus faecium]
IHRITDTKNLTNAKNSVKKDKKVIERLEAQKEKIVYTGNLMSTQQLDSLNRSVDAVLSFASLATAFLFFTVSFIPVMA